MNIQTYLQNKVAQSNCTATLNELGEITINYLGRSFTAVEFDETYPINVIKIDWQNKFYKGENNDRTHNYIHNKKSY